MTSYRVRERKHEDVLNEESLKCEAVGKGSGLRAVNMPDSRGWLLRVGQPQRRQLQTEAHYLVPLPPHRRVRVR